MLLAIFLCVVTSAFCEPNTTILPEIITATTVEDVTTTTPPPPNKTTEMQRIIQPSQSQTQQVLKLQPHPNQPELSKAKSNDFKPSPQLETYFEYNHFPVQPAHPEPKIFGSFEKTPIHSTVPWTEKPQTKQNSDVWTTNVRFPLGSHAVTVNDHPYPFAKETEKPSQQYLPYKPTTSVVKHSSYEPKLHYGETWDKTLVRKPSKTFHEGERMNTDLKSSPWKKIIQLLTAFIPIGLLISALTPSVITIGPMNGTYKASRSQDDTTGPPFGLNFLTQLRSEGCDERIFCELLLSAEETGNSEKSTQILLENYTKGKGNSVKLERIYKAIKNGNCNSLHCDSMKNH